MTNLLRSRLSNAVKQSLTECGDSSKEMIAKNITDFENMGMSSVAPGAFSQEEVTDSKNLENTASMSTGSADESQNCEKPEDLEGFVDISIVKKDETPEEDEMEELVFGESSLCDHLKKMFKEDRFSEEGYTVYLWPFAGYETYPVHVEANDEQHALEKAVAKLEEEGKLGFFADAEDAEGHDDLYVYVDATMEGANEPHYVDAQNLRIVKDENINESSLRNRLKKILTEGDYAGPLRYVPDTRINVADVVNALKAKIGEGSEGICVNANNLEDGSKVYCVSQIDKEKLPKTIDVENVTLKLGDEGYTVEKATEDFPAKKD